MAQATYYAVNTSGGITNMTDSATYPPTVTGGVDTASSPVQLGQICAAGPLYNWSQWFMAFNMASPASGDAPAAGATITAAVLSLYPTDILYWGEADVLDGIYALYYDWTPSGITTADSRTSAQLAGLYTSPGPCAHIGTTMSANTYGSLTSDAYMTTAVTNAIGGTLPLLCVTYDMVTATAPGLGLWTRGPVATQFDATQTHRPRLVVDYTAPVAWSGLIVTRKLQG
jgi:hypothetical protein